MLLAAAVLLGNLFLKDPVCLPAYINEELENTQDVPRNRPRRQMATRVLGYSKLLTQLVEGAPLHLSYCCSY